MNVPDRKQADRFLALLDPTAKAFTFQTFNEAGAGIFAPLILNGTLAECWEKLAARNQAGQGIFVTVNQTDLKGRKTGNITAARAVWQEDDDCFKGKFPLEPSLVIQSSPNKFHRYWLLDRPTSGALAEHKGVMQRLVDDYGSDPNAMDLTRVLRLPGFYHQKGEPHLVIIVETPKERFEWSAVMGAFKPSEPSEEGCVAAWRGERANFSRDANTDTLLRELQEALAVVDANDRTTWITMGEALYELGDEGKKLWGEYAARGDTFDEAKLESDWHSFRDHKIGYKVVFAEAKRCHKNEGNEMRDIETVGNVTKLVVGDGPLERAKRKIVEGYIYVEPLEKFYKKVSGTLISEQALEQSVIPAGKKKIQASEVFKNGGECVDALGWFPCAANMEAQEIITRNKKRWCNTYISPPSVEKNGDEERVKPWLDMMAYIVRNEGEMDVYINHLAATVQHPERKICWQILNYGNKRIGKDLTLQPLAIYFGALASEIPAQLSTSGWGDMKAKRKMLIFAEIYQPGNRAFENDLKALAAPTASGMDTLNMKGGAVIEQANLYSVYAMSNETDCMHLSGNDARWFVIDSFGVEPASDEFYKEYIKWIEEEEGWRKVIAYLMSIDLAEFSWGRLPYKTDAYWKLVAESESLVVSILRERIELRKLPMRNDLVATLDLEKWFRVNHQKKVQLKILSKELKSLGCVKLERGQRKPPKGTRRFTPALWAVRRQEYYGKLTSGELCDAWFAQGKKTLKTIEGAGNELLSSRE